MSEKRNWLLLVYSVPREPSASRVYVWRKLNRLGAIMLQDAVWILPATPQTREQFQWLSGEIEELRGGVSLWESQNIFERGEAELIRQFEERLEKPYNEILKSLKRKNPDKGALSRKFQQLQAQDYFRSTLGQKVRSALIAARGDSA